MLKRNRIIYWISTVWLTLGLASTGIVQLFNIPTAGAGGSASISHLGYPGYILPLLGISKILAVVALLIPRFPLLKEWAYAEISFTITGALFSHMMANDPFTDLAPSLLYLVLIALSWHWRPLERRVMSSRSDHQRATAS